MAETKTKPTQVSVDSFIDAVENPTRREDARAVRAMMERITGQEPRMWGPSIVGFGSYHYVSPSTTSRTEGDWPKVGFSPRKGARPRVTLEQLVVAV